MYKAKKQDVFNGLDESMSMYRVAALIRKEGKIVYDFISLSSQILSDYSPTVLPPKKFFFPKEEVLLDYTVDGNVKARITHEAIVLFGVMPCDLNGMKILNEAFSEANGDPNYLAKRENSLVFAMECSKKCDDDAFCYKVGGQETNGDYDLLFIDRGEYYLIKRGSEKGFDFLEEYISFSSAEKSEFDAFYREKESAFLKEGVPFKDLEKLPEIFSRNKSHEIWEKEGERCTGCGSCVMVCPTCYCFDVVDEWELNLKKGKRVRKWDACMLCEFAAVAGGENFRESRGDRLKHRMNRKFNYLMKKHAQPACVGCGRCVRACLSEISPKAIVETLNGEND